MRTLSRPLVAVLLVACAPQLVRQTAVSGPSQWEPDIERFEAADRTNPPRPGTLVFVGSSSIRMWQTLDNDFPGAPVLNRGFGGSELSDVVRFADRIVVPYEPRVVVVSIKPSIARWNLVDKIRETNQLIRDYARTDDRLVYVDVFTSMLDASGQPRRELFLEDGLHMNARGYAIWRDLIEPILR